MKSFIESQFAYYPLIWMFHGRKVNNFHELSLWIFYKDNISFHHAIFSVLKVKLEKY